MQLILASASPRRADLLRAAGIPFEVMPAEVDETIDQEETPDGYVRRVAQEKAEAVARRVPDRPILGADTAVVVDNRVMGKPGDEREAAEMLRLLSGRRHIVLTGVCLILPAVEAGRVRAAVERTVVEFATLSEAEVEWYVATGEPMDKAGAYAGQGLASRFVTRIEGSYANVVGLPVSLVYRWCAEAGLLLT